ncbi:MAG: N-acetylmuramoyl-L-alanine amidase [Cyanobacteria bacterium REEB67]|nr:N-acetylmuramoyl-L-alanine amidase [Cyanobacteria bacterium REEB67]
MTLRPKIELTLITVFAAASSICSCASNATPKTSATAHLEKHLKIALAEHLPPMPPPTAEKPLLIVYPRGGEIPASTSFIVGSTLPGYQLTVNGAPVKVNKQGFFAHVIALAPGKNNFTVQSLSPNGATATQIVEANRERPPAVMSAASLAFDRASLKPKDDQGHTTGDIIELSCRATPGAVVSAQLGGKTIAMISPAAVRAQKATATAPTTKAILNDFGVNPGLSVAYGQAFQRYPARRADVYVGLYKIQPEDNFVDAPLSFRARKDGKETMVASSAHLTTIKQPLLARTMTNETIVRTAPDAGRLTPLPAGVRLLVDGWEGENIRCYYRPGLHAWIKRSELQMEEAGSPAPNAMARTIIVKKDNFGESIVIPLSQRLPFTIEQSLKPNRLTLKLYGARGDTDWVYQAPVEDDNGLLVDNVTWKQPDDGTYEVTVDLKNNRQWGFSANYGEGENEHALVLKIKNAPSLSPLNHQITDSPGRLKGLKVCIDPGHGGAELGAIGPSGVREAQINLAIALKLRDQLVKEGATIFMTREDDSDVSLDDRVEIARAKGADLLISIHNNALPDGRDPLKEHGTSTYYYHPQSKPLAQALESALARGASLQPIGARYQNLALCRPSAMQAVLVEVGFMINPDEYALLLDDSFQQRAAASLKDGLITYLGRD